MGRRIAVEDMEEVAEEAQYIVTKVSLCVYHGIGGHIAVRELVIMASRLTSKWLLEVHGYWRAAWPHRSWQLGEASVSRPW